jgi:hypothetical protein
MALSSNQLVKQVDLPVFEWTRPLPVVGTAGLSATCTADNAIFQETSGRYIYSLLSATAFWRYDTITDTYEQLSSPGLTVLTASSMKFAGALGYYGRVISAGSNTMFTGLPFGKQAIGYRIRIISGTGVGQERLITDVSDPIIADFGGATAGSALNLTDTTKDWGRGATGGTTNLNNWVGYVVRTISGTGLNQVRKILYNTNQLLTIADTSLYSIDTWCIPLQGGLAPTAGTAGWLAPAAGTLYQIEASTITVDTPWTIQPDNTTRYIIQSGGIWLSSGATVANGGVTMQYYSVLEDIWYAKSIQNNMIPTLLTENNTERITENSTIWWTGVASTGTTTTLTDPNANWIVNQWVGYELFIWSGTGRSQITDIVSNTANVLTFSTLATGLDSTSRYNIVGYDGGLLTSTLGRVITDNTKSWPVDRWKNYVVRIIGGTGDGQKNQILSNGSNSLVVYDTWTVQPDNTSIYAITGHSSDMFINLGGNAQMFLYRAEDCDMLSHNRIFDEGTIQAACALLVDGGSTSTHRVSDQRPTPITSLAGTTTITATTPISHQFKTGQWVSVRGVTSAAADMYNVTGKVQIASVPSTTTFTYVPFAAGSGTYQYSNNVTISTTVLPDASKYHADLATGGSTTSVTFTRAQPSNITGWYVYGTNIAAGAQVQSGAGTTSLTLNLTGAGTPSGTIEFSKWPKPVTIGTGGGGGAGVFTCTIGSALPAYCKGWLVTGTGIAIGAIVTGGEGTTTISLSLPCTGAVSGTITFSSPLNNMLPVSGTYSSGTGTSITLTAPTPSYITNWFVSGTNISNGTVVTGSAGSSTIALSLPTSGTPSGTITFYPPSVSPSVIYASTVAPVVAATGVLTTGTQMQLVAQNTSNGSIMTPISAMVGGGAVAMVPGVSRYIITKRDIIGQQYDQQNLYLSGTATGGSTTTLVDGSAFWATATGSGAAGGTTLTLSAPGSYIHNGWYVAGTGITLGSRVISGGGTTSIVVDQPFSTTVSGTITFTAWTAQNLINRRLRILSGATGLNQDLAITAVTPASGTITFVTATAPVNNVSAYAILPAITPGAGSYIQWQSDSSVSNNRGRFIFRVRGGAAAGIDKFDVTSDEFIPMYTVPFNETLGAGSQFAYDGYDRIYFTKDVTNRLYYLDLKTNTVHGSGLIPYLAGTAGIGNLMEIFKTVDGLKYLWVVRKANVETFRQLLFY